MLRYQDDMLLFILNCLAIIRPPYFLAKKGNDTIFRSIITMQLAPNLQSWSTLYVSLAPNLIVKERSMPTILKKSCHTYMISLLIKDYYRVHLNPSKGLESGVS